MQLPQGGQKKVPDPFEIALQMIECCLTWVLGTKVRISGRAAISLATELSPDGRIIISSLFLSEQTV